LGEITELGERDCNNKSSHGDQDGEAQNGVDNLSSRRGLEGRKSSPRGYEKGSLKGEYEKEDYIQGEKGYLF